MIDYDRELNEEQRRVVLEPGGPLLVIAGAGSGKTRTLTYRVARLIDSGCPPGRIALATFTNKAARSMMSRVADLTSADLSRLWGGTFHHLAHRSLRAHAPRVGYKNDFVIIDADDARQLVRRCVAETVENARAIIPRGEVLRDVISFARNTDRSLEEAIDVRFPYLAPVLEAVVTVAQHYDQEKKRLNVMDFDDLLINWRRLLAEHEDVLAGYAERFLHVLVDEYQDTNAVQADITDLLASRRRNLMVVGDDAQCIYAFRGANYANILKFPEKYPDCKIFKLEENYRSTPEILHMANLSIKNNERQFEKSLRAVRPRGVPPVLVKPRNVQMQAEFVAQRIIELVGAGYCPGEMAILYRAHFHSLELQLELTRRGIPFTIRSGIRFFEQAHIKDVTSYLRIVASPGDEMAWRRVLGLCHRIGRQTVERIWTWLAGHEDPLAAFLDEATRKKVGAAARPGLTALQELLAALGAAEGADLGTSLETILQGGYESYLKSAYPDAVQRLEDIGQLAVFAARFSTPAEFLREMALLTGIGEEGEDLAETGEGRVTMSTIHQAKGLEWPVVFIPWCAEGMLPLGRALTDPEGVEEERRLFYVAVTRAKDELYLCCPAVEYRRGVGYVTVKSSRFIAELTSTASPTRRARPYEHWRVEED
ncbi:MAG: ATP-dependent helicase [Pseudomonadota bacterium]|nr:ATP-dependent helicase [Pseudomonadota bacterium]